MIYSVCVYVCVLKQSHYHMNIMHIHKVLTLQFCASVLGCVAAHTNMGLHVKQMWEL